MAPFVFQERHVPRIEPAFPIASSRAVDSVEGARSGLDKSSTTTFF
jgi:hypothetical protein